MKQTLRPSKNHEGSATRNVNPKDCATLFEPREGAATRKTTTVSKGVPPATRQVQPQGRRHPPAPVVADQSSRKMKTFLAMAIK